MPTTTYELYRPEDFDATASTVSLVTGYTGDDDTVLIVTDDDDNFDGDASFFANEVGTDTNQFGTATFSDGSTLGGPTTQVYSEQEFILTAPGETTISLYRIEIGGQLVGFLPSTPLVPGVTYSYSSQNTTSGNAPEYTDIAGAVCFTADNLIQTQEGPQRAGNLTIGMMIQTRDNGYQPLKWIFRRKLGRAELLRQPELRPILFQPGALAPDQPSRLMRLSPQHRVLTYSPHNELLFGQKNLLVPAKGLVNGTSVVVDETVHEIEYIHLLFDRHEIVFCDGIEAESFDPGNWSLGVLSPEARLELDTLFPELARYGLPADFHQYSSITVREAELIKG